MKKIKLLMLIMGLCFLTGCVKFNANMDIKSNKSMDFSIIYALDKSFFKDENALKESSFDEIKKQGFTVSKYQKDNLEGFTLTKKFSNIDEISTDEDIEFDISGMMNGTSDSKYWFKVVKGDKKNTYYAKFKFDANDSGLNTNEMNDDLADTSLPSDGEEDTDDNNLDFSNLMSNLDLSFNVTLPTAALSNNATKAENDNKNLSWTLFSNGEQTIEFAFELNNENNFLLYVGIGIFVVIVIIIVLLIVFKSKNGHGEIINDNNNEIKIENNDDIAVIDNGLSKPEPVLKNEQE